MGRVSRLAGILLVFMAGFLGACGGDDETAKGPPGSPDNPIVAKAEPDQESNAPENESAGKQGGSGSSDSSSGSASSGGSGANGEPEAPSYQELVKKQTKKPQSTFTPCNLVTKAQASEIVGKPLKDPLEAPQGPTCIYQPESGKDFITVAVQSIDFKKVKPHLGQPTEFTVGSRTGYCGQYGQAMAYVPLADGKLLSISGPCAVAKQFASAAVPRLG